jgi:hypothetical protein
VVGSSNCGNENLGSEKWGISWLAENRLPSQEDFRSMKKEIFLSEFYRFEIMLKNLVGANQTTDEIMVRESYMLDT